MKKYALLLLLLTIIDIKANDEAFSFDKISLKGKGCKNQNTSIVTSLDNKTVSLLFDSFYVEVPQYDGDNDNDLDGAGGGLDSKFNKNKSRKVCLIDLKTTIPKGQRVESVTIEVDYRGAASVEKGTFAVFRSSLVNWQGPRGMKSKMSNPLVAKRWNGRNLIDDDFIIETKKTIPVRSGCRMKKEKNFKLRLRSVIAAAIKKNRLHEDLSAFIGVDSADLTSRLKVTVNTGVCRKVRGRRMQRARRGARMPERGFRGQNFLQNITN